MSILPEKSLLLYLEARAVDFSGTIDSRHVSPTEFEQLKAWQKEGFISFGRICKSDGATKKLPTIWCDYWVELSEAAWAQAHTLRKERGARVLANRQWEKTAET